MSQWQGMFLRGKHAWTCLLRVLATWDFHATVDKGKEGALEPTQQSGFQQSGFWITMLGFRIPLAGFRIPKPWIPDSTDQNYLDTGFRITLHGATCYLAELRGLDGRARTLRNSVALIVELFTELYSRNTLFKTRSYEFTKKKYWNQTFLGKMYFSKCLIFRIGAGNYRRKKFT